MMKLGHMSEVDEFNTESGEYLDLVEKCIEDKIKLMDELRKEVQNLRRKKNDADEVTKMLQEQKLH